MIPRYIAPLLLDLSMVLLALPLCAGDGKAPDPDLPQPLDLQAAQPLLESSPFTRPLDLSDSLMLTGIAYVQGKPLATITDKITRQSYLVSEEPNAQGWKLAGASASNEPRRSQVKLLVGTEEVIIHYNDSQLAPTSSKSAFASRFPTPDEYNRKDENGKAYISGSAYLSDADRDRYRTGLSKEAHDKFRQEIRDNREKMFSASPEERAAFAKKVFDSVVADDKGKAAK